MGMQDYKKLVYKELRLLIVETREEISQELLGFSKELGIGEAVSESNFKRAGELLKREKYDVVLFGDKYSNISVVEMLKFLKNSCEGKKTRFILCTSSKDPVFVRQLVSEGASSVLLYPSNLKGMGKAIDCCQRLKEPEDLEALVDKTHFLDDFSREEKTALLSVALPRSFEAGEEIIAKGDIADRFYILLKGKVLVVIAKEDHSLIDICIEEGSSFGEMAIVDEMPRSAWCVAASDCLVLEIGYHIINDPNYNIRTKLFAKLAVVMAERIRKMNELVNQKIREGSDWFASKTCEGRVRAAVEGGIMEKKGTVQSLKPRKKAKSEGERILKEKKSSFQKLKEESIQEENVQEKKLEENPYLVPRGVADSYHEGIKTLEEYEVLTRKIKLRSDFIFGKVPLSFSDMVCNKLFGYWTGSKLAKVNPHHKWNTELFVPGSPQLKKALHLVVVNNSGDSAFKKAYLKLPISQQVIGLSDVGCLGTFLGSNEAIDRYLNDQCLKKSIRFDMEMAIDRTWQGKDVIEFLLHTPEDVRDETLFLIFDGEDGENTRRFRQRFPYHQMITVVKGIGFNCEEPSTAFSIPEKKLLEKGCLHPKDAYEEKGFYQGQTVFFSDISMFYDKVDSMKDSGYIFATIAILARMGPDYSGVIWGSKGGAEGAVKAARAMFGIKGAQTPGEIASAVNWADGSSEVEE